MVGEELGLSEEQVEGLIAGIRTEKYSEANGIRTELQPPKRSQPSAPQQVPVIDVVPVGRPSTAGDFEFVDDHVDAEPGGAEANDDDTEEDARTEASDALSDITDD